MKQFELLSDYRGIPKGTILYGGYPVKGGTANVYVQKADIPTDPSQGVSFGIYESAINDPANSEIFKLVTNENKA